MISIKNVHKVIHINLIEETFEFGSKKRNNETPPRENLDFCEFIPLSNL